MKYSISNYLDRQRLTRYSAKLRRLSAERARIPWVLALLVGTLAAVAAGCGPRQAGQGQVGDPVRAIPVKVAPAARGTVEKTVAIAGRIAAQQEAVLTAKAPGRVSQVAVSLGDTVRRGQVLVRLETADPAARLEQAQAAFDAARANNERMRSLFDEGAVSRQQWEQAELQQTQAAVALDLARSALADTTIVAPFDGAVTSLAVEAGETASPGVPLLTVVDPSRLYLEGSVSDTHAPLIARDREVRVEIEALPGRTFSGRIESIAAAADSQRRTFPVRIALPDPPPGLRAGMFARAILPLERSEGALLVPVEAVLGQDGERHLYVVEGKVARRRKVETGLSDGVMVEVRSGLREGERVVVAGQQYLKDGAPVETADGSAGERR